MSYFLSTFARKKAASPKQHSDSGSDADADEERKQPPNLDAGSDAEEDRKPPAVNEADSFDSEEAGDSFAPLPPPHFHRMTNSDFSEHASSKYSLHELDNIHPNVTVGRGKDALPGPQMKAVAMSERVARLRAKDMANFTLEAVSGMLAESLGNAVGDLKEDLKHLAATLNHQTGELICAVVDVEGNVLNAVKDAEGNVIRRVDEVGGQLATVMESAEARAVDRHAAAEARHADRQEAAEARAADRHLQSGQAFGALSTKLAAMNGNTPPADGHAAVAAAAATTATPPTPSSPARRSGATRVPPTPSTFMGPDHEDLAMARRIQDYILEHHQKHPNTFVNVEEMFQALGVGMDGTPSEAASLPTSTSSKRSRRASGTESLLADTPSKPKRSRHTGTPASSARKVKAKAAGFSPSEESTLRPDGCNHCLVVCRGAKLDEHRLAQGCAKWHLQQLNEKLRSQDVELEPLWSALADFYFATLEEAIEYEETLTGKVPTTYKYTYKLLKNTDIRTEINDFLGLFGTYHTACSD